MGKIKLPQPVKLVVGFIFSEEEIFIQTKKRFVEKYGEIDFESRSLFFKYTDYYRKEMGENLFRKFLSFKKLIMPEEIVEAKLFSVEVEKSFYLPGTEKRRINIDPGYLTLSKLVLATTKNFAHRIYLGRGVYAEVTLRYLRGEGFIPWEWTYPDYRSRDYLEIFNKLRSLLKNKYSNKDAG